MSTEGANGAPPRGKPVYIAWRILAEFIDHLKDKPVPEVIDTSMMQEDLKQGMRTQLRAALRFLGLIGPKGEPTEQLRELVAARDGEGWEAQVRQLMSNAYAHVTGDLDLQTATTGQLDTAFRERGGVDGQVLDKAVRFYLAGLKEGDEPLSPYLETKGARAASAARQPRRKPRKRASGSGANPPEEQASAAPIPPGGTRVIRVPDGFINHQFLLRRGLVVQIPLPEDLKTRDVERLHTWLSSLPVPDDEGSDGE